MRISTVGRLDANAGAPSGIALRLDNIPGINPDTQLPIKVVFQSFAMLTPSYPNQIVEYGRIQYAPGVADYASLSSRAYNADTGTAVEKTSFTPGVGSTGSVVVDGTPNTVEFSAGNGGAPPNVVMIGAEDPAVQMEWVADIYMLDPVDDSWVPLPVTGYTLEVSGIDRYYGGTNDVTSTDAVAAGYVTVTGIPEPSGCFWTDLLRVTQDCGSDPVPEPFWYSLLPNFAASQRWVRYPGEFGTALPHTSADPADSPGIGVRYLGGPEGAITKIRYSLSAQTSGSVGGSPPLRLRVGPQIVASTTFTSGSPVVLASSGDVDLVAPIPRSDSAQARLPVITFRVEDFDIPATTFNCTQLEIYVEPGEGIPGEWMTLDAATGAFAYLAMTTQPGVTWDSAASELYANDLALGEDTSVFKVEYGTTTWLRFTTVTYEGTSPGAGTTLQASEIHVSASGDAGVFTQFNRNGFPGSWGSDPLVAFVPSPALIPVESDYSPHVDYLLSNAALETFRYKIEIWVET